MASYGWGTGRSIEEWLFEEGRGFDFYQAVKLLEMLHPDPVSVGEGALPDREAVRFKSKVGFEFPATEVVEINNSWQDETPLFSLEGELQTDLDNRVIPEGLRETFRAHRIPFSRASVDIVKKSRRWRLIDTVHKHTYYINYINEIDKNGNRFKVYDGKPLEVVVDFMGLAGGLGPLPAPYTKLILDRMRNGDTVLRDFLDIFNHRLVSLVYRVRKMHCIGFDCEPPGRDHFAKYLFALLGLGTKGLQGRMRVKDRSLLFYTGLLAQQPRSAVGLESLLSDYFKVEVKVRQFCGRWHRLEEDQWTIIGISGRHQRLGLSFLLGNRIYYPQGKIELCLLSLTLREFLDFLPTGQGFRALCELTRLYIGPEIDFDILLSLKAAEIPGFRLGLVTDSRLGWTSWLKTKEVKVDVPVRLETST
jgi:type VI secretion system protein ImpH